MPHVTSTCTHCTCASPELSGLTYQLEYQPNTLLAYFPIHQDNRQSGQLCSTFRPKEGFLSFMAFRYAIDRVNQDPRLMSDVKLGYLAFDTCSDPDVARSAFVATDQGLRFFDQPPQVPMVTHVYGFVGGFEKQVVDALSTANMESKQLVQVGTGLVDT